MRVPFVKEHGAWFVFILSCAAGIITGFSSAVQYGSARPYLTLILAIAGMALLINAKAPAVSLIRSGSRRGEDAVWLLIFFISGMLLLSPFLSYGLISFLPFALLTAAYYILVVLGKEHLVVTELIGFSLLATGGAVTFFILTGTLSFKLYTAVFIFFSAGVFKVRLRMKKDLFYKLAMAVYCLAAAGIYTLMGLSFLILLPLTENMLYSVWTREEKLKVTGNTELVKGVLFLLLLGLLYTK